MRTIFAVSLLTLLAAPTYLFAQGQATVLEPITPVEVEPWNRETLVAADPGGQVMVAFLAERDGDNEAWSCLSSGGAWSSQPIPLPPGHDRWRSHELRDLAAGSDGRFVLLYKNQGGNYVYAVWSGSAWQTPVAIPDDDLDTPSGICFDASGDILVWDDKAPGYFGRHAGGQWQSMQLAQRTDDVSSEARGELVSGRDGAVHLMGISQRKVPTVGSCPAGADPVQPGNWVFQPELNREHSSPIYSGVRYPQLSLDWPRQLVWAAWRGVGGADSDVLFVSHAPIGTTAVEQWSTWEARHEGWKTTDFRLASSSAGADGVAYVMSDGHGGRQIIFRWLPPNGLGAPVEIARPGSQTEAADFSQFNNGTLAMCVGADGTAHIVIKGKKRGEYPENAERLFYSRVSGGAVLQTEPGVEGGGTVIAGGQTGGTTGGQQQDWQQQGGKPDLVPVLDLGGYPYSRDGEEVYRFGYYDRIVRPQVAVRNIASQYFGDVELDLIVDGAVVHYVRHDDTGHMRPLIERDGTLTVYNLPRFRYEYRPQEGWTPPEVQLADSARSGTMSMYSGLGRKTVTLIVDPQDRIDEENEDNNTVELQFEISDGREDDDRLALTDTHDDRLNVGRNDLAILGTPQLHANTRIAAPGLLQAPTDLRMIVGNPRGATFFRDVDVVALLDGNEIWRHTIPLMDNERRLYNRETQWFGYTGRERRSGPEVMGGFLDVPIDLTDVAVGNHTLTLVVDPDDRCADLERDNNTATIPLRVRERGGTLIVLVKDLDTGADVPRAHVLLGNLFFDIADERGALHIADVPAGSYDARDLWVRRPYPEPRYGARCADDAFTVRNDETTQVTVRLEQPVDVTVTVLDAVTGEATDSPPAAALSWAGTGAPWYSGESGEIGGWRQGGSRLLFPEVRPGPCTVTASAYAYLDATSQVDVHRDAQGRCAVEISLQRAPRGSVEGTVVDQDGRPVRGLGVRLQDAPRYGGTDASGHFTIGEVAAGRRYTVIAWGDDYTQASAPCATVPEGGSVSVSLQVNHIVSREAQLGFDAITWAQLESWPGFSFGPVSADSYEVSAQHGMFHATVGARWHEIQGADRVVVDEVVLATRGDAFWEESISYTYSFGDIINAGITKVAGKTIGQLCKLAGPINDVYDYFHDDIDPQQLNEGEVVGTYTSWTGTERESATLIPIPGLEFSPGFHGGQTVVRCDMVEVTDGQTTKTIRQQWYSPAMMAYQIGEEMDLENLEVRFYVRVLNERLSPGPLYANSQNVIIWRPTEDNWLRFEPSAYDALGLD